MSQISDDKRRALLYRTRCAMAGAGVRHWINLSRKFPQHYKGVPENLKEFAIRYGVIVD